MILPNGWGALEWSTTVATIVILGIALLTWAYALNARAGHFRWLLGLLKLGAIGLLALCLLEPLQQFERPRPGANVMVVMADNSRSLRLKDRGETTSRGEELAERLSPDQSWLKKLELDFDLRKYIFSDRLEPTRDFSEYEIDGQGSAIAKCLKSAAAQFQKRPVAGIIMLSDGNATDFDTETNWSELPPIYPVVVGAQSSTKDIGIDELVLSQSNFESAPVSVVAQISSEGYAGKPLIAQLIDNRGEEIERKEIVDVEDGQPFTVRFQLKPEHRESNSVTVRCFAKHEQSTANATDSKEATWNNNERTAVIDRGQGPFRILYISGRPNWEYKFLRRAAREDLEVNLVGLIRIARKAPKFTFRSQDNESTNSLYRGFGNEDDQTAEQYDEAVLIRLDTQDKEELRHGFPKDEAELFQYDGIILDDIEANFFTEDQKSLLHQFVNKRGGGLMMLGGSDSFREGGYDRTPIGETLPIYLDQVATKNIENQYRVELTRDGWVQPWMRINATEMDEKKRMDSMPGFKILNATESIKPGATVMLNVVDDNDQSFPGLVVQSFGKGRTAAFMIGDLWRWHLDSPLENNDLMKSWRQTLRWLVGEAPKRVDVSVRPQGPSLHQINVKVRDPSFGPLDNAKVNLSIKSPSGQDIRMVAGPTPGKSGEYQVDFVSREKGVYQVLVNAQTSDQDLLPSRESAWVAAPNAMEFDRLKPDRAFLQQLADKTGGRVIEMDELNGFVNRLDRVEVPISEIHTEPWWHQWPIFLLATSLLVCEWGLRRWKGLP